MVSSLTKTELKEYLAKQLNHLFPDNYKLKGTDTDIALNQALEKVEYCFSQINFRHYSENGEANFKHLYSDQYSQFLYIYARELWLLSQNKPICDKLVLLNKALNGILCPYTVKMPSIFFFLHPVGTVIGNANFSDYLVIAQNVTINNSINKDGIEELNIGKGVFLSAGSKIIGTQPIGDFSSIGVNTTIYNIEVPSNMIAYNDIDGVLVMKERKKQCKAQEFFYKIK